MRREGNWDKTYHVAVCNIASHAHGFPWPTMVVYRINENAKDTHGACRPKMTVVLLRPRGNASKRLVFGGTAEAT